MNFDSIKNIRPSGLDISNADAQYADYISSLPQHKSKKQIITVISTVAAAVLVVVAVSIWAIIGSGFRSKSNNDPIITPASADDNVQKPENTKPTDTDTPQKPEQSATNNTKPPMDDKIDDKTENPNKVDDLTEDPDKVENTTEQPQKDEQVPVKPQENQTNGIKPPFDDVTEKAELILGNADIDKIGFREAYKEKPNLCDDIELAILDTMLLSNSTKKIELNNTLTEQIMESVIKKYKIQLMPTFVITDNPGLSTYNYLIALGMDVSTIEAANKSAAKLFGYDNIFTIQPEAFNIEKSYDYNNVVIDSAYSYKTKDGHSCYSIEFYRKEYKVPTRFTLTYTGKSITEPDIFFEHNISHEVTSDFTRENYTPMFVDLTGLKISISGNSCTFVGQPDINSRINRAVKNGGALVKFVKKGDSIGYDNGHGITNIFDTPIEITEVYCGNLKKGDIVSLVRVGEVSSDNSKFYVETVDSIKPTPLLQDGVEYFGLLYYNDSYSVDGFASFVGNAYTEVANILQNNELSEAYDKYR